MLPSTREETFINVDRYWVRHLHMNNAMSPAYGSSSFARLMNERLNEAALSSGLFFDKTCFRRQVLWFCFGAGEMKHRSTSIANQKEYGLSVISPSANQPVSASWWLFAEGKKGVQSNASGLAHSAMNYWQTRDEQYSKRRWETQTPGFALFRPEWRNRCRHEIISTVLKCQWEISSTAMSTTTYETYLS